MRMTTPDAARYLGAWSPRTLEKWRVKGIGPRFRIVVGKVLYDQAELDAFVERQALLQSTSGKRRRASKKLERSAAATQ